MKNIKKILVCDNISESGLKALYEAGDFEIVKKGKLSPDELEKIIPEFDALLVRSGTKVGSKAIEKAKNLKIIARAGVGIDNIDLAAATEKGVLVINAPSGNTIAACEHTIGLILSLARKIPLADVSVKQGKWEKKKFLGVELYGKTAGIVGLGKIGFEVAKRLAGFQMKVIGFDPYLPKGAFSEYGIELVDFDTLVRTADIISVHVPKNEKTVNLFNYEVMSGMKKSAFLVNCSRGGIINEDDLVKILEEEKIKGAALDVFGKEPLERDDLRKLANIVLTPHLGASTVEAQEKVARSVAGDIVKFFEGEIPLSSCNFRISGEFPRDDYNLYVKLAEKLGSFLSQTTKGAETVKIVYGGEIAEWDRTPIKSAFLQGFLGNILDERVNLVNAVPVARKRGLRCEEAENPEKRNFLRYISVSSQSQSLKGIVYLKDVRLVEFNGFATDISMDGNLIVFSNRDIPGIIGKTGTLLGESGINIASMDVARREKNKTAFTIIKVDEIPSPETLEKIGEIEGISDVMLIKL
ncbi:MAG: phosphoglycerate dehydrogenase [Elusimicrobia bacterium]|nr:phosphoglycerate dehydrogenase [Elusimicrobiota bacterium]